MVDIDSVIASIMSNEIPMIEDAADVAEHLGGDRNFVMGLDRSDGGTALRVNSYLIALIAKKLQEVN